MAMQRDAASHGSRGTTLQPSNTNTNTNTTNSHRSDSTGGKRPTNNGKSKGVAWADDKAKTAKQQEQDQLTFYREGTPPPLDDDDYHHQSLSTGPHTAGAYSYDYSYDRVAPPAPIPQATICGIRKRLFWIVVAAAILVVVIALGAGIGAGVGTKRASSTSDESNSTSAPSSSVSIHTVTPTSIALEPTQTPLLACPAANNTKYEVKSVKKTFLRVCGVDYTGGDGAVDLGVVWTSSMQDCMNSCAGYPNCTGCSWGVIPGDAGSDHRCWLKNDLKEVHVVRSGWDFAILQ